MFGMPGGFDPSKMDPKVLMELSNLVRELPPAQIQRMQSLMHNMMAGFDVRTEMEEFERSLPAGFRERMFQLMVRSGVNPITGAAMPGVQSSSAQVAGAEDAEVVAPMEEGAAPTDVREARLMILRAVAEGRLSPEEAEPLLRT